MFGKDFDQDFNKQFDKQRNSIWKMWLVGVGVSLISLAAILGVVVFIALKIIEAVS